MDIPTLTRTYNDHAVIEALEDMERNEPKKLRSKLYPIRDTKEEWRSWTMREYVYKKKDNGFPTMARGLFTAQEYRTATYPILARGYDKFFNILETDGTQWPSLKSDTQGPYYATAKENGCIIFIAALNNFTVVVTSKHSIPNPQDDPSHHGGVGYRWLLKHLDSVGLKESDLASWLSRHNVTLVAELCDDQFEEHILPYAPKDSGLYLHGINYNVSVLHTLSPETVQQVARHFGFLITEFTKFDTLEEIQALADDIGKDGKFQGRPIEGVVVRCKRQCNDFFFKIKNDYYLLYRDYREITKSMIHVTSEGNVELKSDVKPRCSYEKSIYYVLWLRKQVKEHPEWFVAYNKNKGIIHVRNQFEEFWDSGDFTSLEKDPVLYIDKTKR